MSDRLWTPSDERKKNSSMHQFGLKIKERFGLRDSDYPSLHKFSVEASGSFWRGLIEYFEISFEGSLDPEKSEESFLNYPWFPQVKLNFAENLLKRGDDTAVALNFVHESGLKREVTYSELRSQVGSLAHALKNILLPGETLACYMPNSPETVVSMLAASSLGACFTSTSSDFGVEGVIDRFGQSRPKVLVAAVKYTYGGKEFDQLEKIRKIASELDSVEKIILVDIFDNGEDKHEGFDSWSEILKGPSELNFVKRKFSDPLYIMYSSGTTGKPKCIVHSIGGTLLQHVKELGLHTDLKPEKNIFYFTTCGWMMWNWLVSSLFFGSKVTLYEGSPGYPSLGEFFEIIDREKIHIFGTSPKFLAALEANEVETKSSFDSLETLLSTGAPLLPEQFDYIYQNIKSDLQVSSICGGTDIIGCFMLGNPLLPVMRGEIQCLGLGMDVSCFDPEGKEIFDVEGELVCRRPFPSQPIGFLGDTDNKKFSQAYFEKFPGVWHHGDYITLTPYKSVRVFGRSDATLNPGGVRIGTSEIYRQTEQLPYLLDSLCIGKQIEGDVEVQLFVKMAEGESLTAERIKEIQQRIKVGTTPRHIPKVVQAVSDIPYTRSGKKMEILVTKLINGKAIDNLEAVANPASLDDFKRFI